MLRYVALVREHKHVIISGPAGSGKSGMAGRLASAVSRRVQRLRLTREAGACTEGDLDSDPGDCANYQFCVHGNMEQFSCQDGTVWDNALKVCNFADQVQCFAQIGIGSGNGSTDDKPDQNPEIESGVVLVVGDRNINDNNLDDNFNDFNDSDIDLDSGAKTDNVSENYPTTPQGLSGDYKVKYRIGIELN